MSRTMTQRGIAVSTQAAGWQKAKYAGRPAYIIPIRDRNGKVFPTKRIRFLDDQQPRMQWAPRKPDNPDSDWYLLDFTADAIREAGGVIYLANGSTSAHSFIEAGIRNVIATTMGELSVPSNAIDLLQFLGVTELRNIPDCDETGRRGALNWRDKLRDSGIRYMLYSFGEDRPKGFDANDLWIECGFDANKFQQIIRDLSLVKLASTKPRQTTVTQQAPLLQETPRALIEEIARRIPGCDLANLKPNGFTQNFHCPHHDDKNPSAGMNAATGVINCFSCNGDGPDGGHSPQKTAEVLGIDWRQYYKQEYQSNASNVSLADLMKAPVMPSNGNGHSTNGNGHSTNGNGHHAPAATSETAPEPTVKPVPPKFQLLKANDLDDLPPVEWLVDGEIVRGGLNVLYGASGSGKSFISLDYAERISQDHTVVYVAAEGASGYGDRHRAWKIHHKQDPQGLHFIIEPLNLLQQDEVMLFIESLRAINPDMIIFDTLARCMVGGDENSARDMGMAIDNANRIQRGLDAAVMIVHHTGKTGSSERGSSALRGAADMMIKLDNDEGFIRLSCDKSKDSSGFGTKALRLLPVDIGNERTSCLVVAAEKIIIPEDNLTEKEASVIEWLSSTPIFDQGARAGDLRRAIGMAESTFFNVIRRLMKRGFIGKENKYDPYILTEKGREIALARGFCDELPETASSSIE